jgi:O-acetylserine/cysteine efflux transporter
MNAGLNANDTLRLAAVVVIWGLNFVVMKIGLRELSPMMLGALRFFVAALPLLLLVRRPALPLRHLLGYGLVQGVGQFGLLFLAIKLGMPAGMASLVLQTQAFFTLLIAVPVLGERALPAQWMGLGVSMLGLVAIACAHGEGTGQMTLVGFVLTLSAAFMWAVANVFGRVVSRMADYNPFDFIVWSSLAPIVPFLCLAVWQDGPARVQAQLMQMSLASLACVLYLGGLSTLVAYSLWTQMLKRHPPGKVVPWSLLVPVIGLAAAAVVFDERLAPLQWIGAAAVMLGLVINQGFGWMQVLRRRRA